MEDVSCRRNRMYEVEDKKNGYLQIIPFTGMRCVEGGGGDCMC